MTKKFPFFDLKMKLKKFFIYCENEFHLSGMSKAFKWKILDLSNKVFVISAVFSFVGKAYFIPLCHSSGQRKLILCQLWIRFRFDPLKKNFISPVLQFPFIVKNASHRGKQFFWSVCLQYYFLNTILHRNTISSFNVSDVLVTTFCQNYSIVKLHFYFLHSIVRKHVLSTFQILTFLFLWSKIFRWRCIKSRLFHWKMKR